MTNKDNKKFKVFANTTKKQKTKTYELEADGSLIITGLASTTNKDLQNDIVEPSAIESMKQQAVGINLLMDHNVHDTREIIGAITEVTDTDEHELRIKARIRPKYASEVKEMLDTGINLGLSISGDVTDYSESETDYGWTIRDINLYEISLTGMPANWDTFGTVTSSKGLVTSTCLSGACYELLKQKQETDNMKNKNKKTNTKKDNEAEETLTRQEAVDLFNELTAENNEQLKADIVEELKPEVEKLVEEKLGQEDNKTDDAVDNSSTDNGGDGEGESKAQEDNELMLNTISEIKELLTDVLEQKSTSGADDEDDDSVGSEDDTTPVTDEEEEDKDKTQSKSKSNVDSDVLNEKLVKTVTEQVLEDLTKNRMPTGSKLDKTLNEETNDKPTDTHSFSKMLLGVQ